jgi:hypothetical protein
LNFGSKEKGQRFIGGQAESLIKIFQSLFVFFLIIPGKTSCKIGFRIKGVYSQGVIQVGNGVFLIAPGCAGDKKKQILKTKIHR